MEPIYFKCVICGDYVENPVCNEYTCGKKSCIKTWARYSNARYHARKKLKDSIKNIKNKKNLRAKILSLNVL